MPDVDDPHDWISQREVAQILHEEIGVNVETARRMLVAGLLGRPRRTRRADYYLLETVDAFVADTARRGPVPAHDRNLVVVRVGHGRVRYGVPRHELLERLGEGWRLSPQWRVLFEVLIERGQRPGFLVTVGGFVVLGAEISHIERTGDSAPLPSPLRVWPLGRPIRLEGEHTRDPRRMRRLG